MPKRPWFSAALAKTELFVFLIILVALWFRVYRLNEFPPALHWDEAYDGLDALRLVQTPSHPIFFDGDNGREPLTIYLQTVGLALWGVRDWALRIVSAMLGIATVPMLFRLGLVLYAGDKRAKRIGAIAAGLLAVSLWHIALSRLSMRVISFPLLSAIAVWFFWRAWQNRRLSYYALCGTVLGLTLYTYLSARLLPFVIVAFVLATALLMYFRAFPSSHFDLPRASFGVAVALLVMLVVFAPLGFYFLQHPGAFFQRASQISIFSANAQGWASLPYTAVATLRMFIDRGDVDILRNMPGAPAFNLLTAVGFWVGTVVALARVRARPVYLLLLLWFGISIAPGLFSVDTPSALRASGALPPALLLAADGLMRIWERVIPGASYVALLGIAVLFGGVLSFNDYFNVWQPSQATFDSVYGPTRLIVDHAIAQSQATDVVLPFSIYSKPTAQFYLAPHFSVAQPLQGSLGIRPAVWISSGAIDRNLVILQKDGAVLVPQPLSDAQIVRLGESFRSAQPVMGPFGENIASEIRLDDASEFLSGWKPTHPLDLNFGNQIKMLGYDLSPSKIVPGGKIQVTYYWQSLVDGETNYIVASNLIDPFSNSIAKRIDDPVYETSLWRRGAVIAQPFQVQVPANAHEGYYRLEVGLLSSDDPNQSLALTGAEDRIKLDPIAVTSRDSNPNAIRNLLNAALGEPPLMTLLGYDSGQSTWRAGEALRLTLYWKSERPAAIDYSVFMHLLDANGKIAAQQDGPPQNGNAPTSWWQPGDVIEDTHELQIPSGTLPGRYALEIGVYDSRRGLRLPLSDAAGNKLGDSLQLSVEVIGP